MKKVENYLETLKLKKCLFGGIAPKQIEIVIQEICMLYDLELYNKNNELEQERKKNEQQDIRMEKVAEYFGKCWKHSGLKFRKQTIN